MTAPASRSRPTTDASFAGLDPSSASDPAVVSIRSAVSMLSLIRTGMPCRGPLAPFSLRSRSSSRAIVRASGFTSMTALSAAPLRSTASIRSRYRETMLSEVSRPASIDSCSPAIVASSSANTASGASFAADFPAGRSPPFPHPIPRIRAKPITAAIRVLRPRNLAMFSLLSSLRSPRPPPPAGGGPISSPLPAHITAKPPAGSIPHSPYPPARFL